MTDDKETQIIKDTSRRIRNSLYRDESAERAEILNKTLDEHGVNVDADTWSALLSSAENHAERMDDLLGGRFAGTKINPA